MRTAFIEQLVEEAKHNDKIFLLIGDLGYNVVNPFMEQFPDRFLNVGICEQNMAGIAGGLAMSGYNVYIYSIGNFPTLRCLEQIRNDITYYNANVKVVSVGAGFAYGSQGMSHHATEDLGIMRALPNMVVCSPSDPSEAKAITRLSANYHGCMYIRLGKAGEKQIFPLTDYQLEIGQLHSLLENDSNNAIIGSGSIMSYASEWAIQNNIQTSIYSAPFIKPICTKQLAEIASKHKNIIVIDEHQKSCGLASALLEQFNDLYYCGKISTFPKIKRVEIDDNYIHVAGNQNYLREISNLLLNKEMFK